MTDYYVDSVNGDDANSGSELLPFASLQTFMDLNLTGDLSAHSLNLAMGSHWRELLTMTNANGTASRKFKISSYGEGDKPKINGADLCAGFEINVVSASIFKNTSTALDQDIIYNDVKLSKVTSLGAMTVNTTYYDSGNTTLYAWLSDGSNPNDGAEITSRTNCVIISTTTGYVIADGIHAVHGRTTGISFNTPSTIETPTLCRITNNLVERCGLDATSGTASDGILCYGSATGARLTNYVIANNDIRDCFNNAVEIAFADECQIKFNAAHHCGGNLAELWDSCDNNIVERNYAEDLQRQGLQTTFHASFGWVTSTNGSTSNIFKSNICIGASRGLHFAGGANEAYNNVFLDITNQCLTINNTAIGVVKNNILGIYNGIGAEATTKYIYVETPLVSNDIDNNLYFESSTGGGQTTQWQSTDSSINTGVFATWQAGGEDANSFSADPLLDNDYKPQAGSDALAGGVSVADIDLDYEGTPWAAIPDIGAYQSFKTPITTSVSVE